MTYYQLFINYNDLNGVCCCKISPLVDRGMFDMVLVCLRSRGYRIEIKEKKELRKLVQEHIAVMDGGEFFPVGAVIEEY